MSRPDIFRFDSGLPADRLVGTTDWLLQRFNVLGDGGNADTPYLDFFGASTRATAALVAAAKKADTVRAVVVSRAGQPDLAEEYLDQVRAPTLLLVGGNDKPVIGLNQEAYGKLRLLKNYEKKLIIIPEPTHLFEEPGTLEQVAQLAGRWFSY